MIQGIGSSNIAIYLPLCIIIDHNIVHYWRQDGWKLRKFWKLVPLTGLIELGGQSDRGIFKEDANNKDNYISGTYMSWKPSKQVQVTNRCVFAETERHR